MLLLQLLGGVSLLGDSGPLTGPATQRRRLALLARLASAPDASVSRDKLIACFWPEDDRERARHFLADSVFTLRRALGKEFLRSAGDDLVLDPAAVSCDLWRFDAALRDGRLEEAVALYRGPFLDGFFIGDAPEFERWVEEERAAVAARYAGALQRLAEEMEGRGHHASAATWWARLAALDPLSTRVALRLMNALAEGGDRAAAIRHARVHAALLREELGLDPDPQVEALAAELTSGSAGGDAPPSPSTEDAGMAAEGGEPPAFPGRAGWGATADAASSHPETPAGRADEGESRATPHRPAPGALPPSGERLAADDPVRAADEGVARLFSRAGTDPEAVAPATEAASDARHFQSAPSAHPGREIPAEAGGASRGGGTGRRASGLRRWPEALRRSIPLLPLLALTLLLSTAIRESRDRPEDTPVPRATPATTVAVMPFRFQGPSEEGYLSKALVTLLSASLDGAGDLHAVDANVVLSRLAGTGMADAALPTLSVAGEIASDFDAGLFALGNVVSTGDRLHLSVTLFEHAPRPVELGSATVEGRLEDLISLVEELARQLLIDRLPEQTDRLTRLAMWDAPFPAVKAYLRGEDEFRAARYPQAAELLQRAVAEDSSFALAHYRLSMALEWSFRFADARRAAREAVSLSAPLPTRDQLLIVGWDRFVRGDAEGAERAYQQVLSEDPDDLEAWSGIGETAVHYNAVRGMSDEAAIHAFRQVLRLAPGFGEARFHLLEFAARAGDREGFATLLAGVDPGSPQLLSWQAARAVAWEGRLPDSLRVKLETAPDNIVAVAAVRTAIHFRDLEGAQALARLLTRPERPHDWRAAGQIMMAQGHFARGAWDEAGALLDSARAVAPEWSLEIEAIGALLPHSPATRDDLLRLRERLLAWEPGRSNPPTTFFFATHWDSHAQLRLYLLALLSIGVGDDAAAQDYGEMLRRTGGSAMVGEQGRAWTLSVEAHRSGSRREHEGVVRLLRGSRLKAPLERVTLSPFFSQAPDRFLRAEALRELGRREDALRWYASLTDSPDLLWWAPAHRRQAELLAELGRQDEAEAHLRRLSVLLAP